MYNTLVNDSMIDSAVYIDLLVTSSLLDTFDYGGLDIKKEVLFRQGKAKPHTSVMTQQ